MPPTAFSHGDHLDMCFFQFFIPWLTPVSLPVFNGWWCFIAHVHVKLTTHSRAWTCNLMRAVPQRYLLTITDHREHWLRCSPPVWTWTHPPGRTHHSASPSAAPPSPLPASPTCWPGGPSPRQAEYFWTPLHASVSQLPALSTLHLCTLLRVLVWPLPRTPGHLLVRKCLVVIVFFLFNVDHTANNAHEIHLTLFWSKVLLCVFVVLFKVHHPGRRFTLAF